MKGWKRILLSYNSWEFVKILPNSPLLLTETWQSKFLSSLHFFSLITALKHRVLLDGDCCNLPGDREPTAVLDSVLPASKSLYPNQELGQSWHVNIACSSTRPNLCLQRQSVWRLTPLLTAPQLTDCMQQLPHIGVSIGHPCPDPENCERAGKAILIMILLRVRRKPCACRWHNGGKQQLSTPGQSVPLLSALPSSS